MLPWKVSYEYIDISYSLIKSKAVNSVLDGVKNQLISNRLNVFDVVAVVVFNQHDEFDLI